jgi:hypothetical protein
VVAGEGQDGQAGVARGLGDLGQIAIGAGGVAIVHQVSEQDQRIRLDASALQIPECPADECGTEIAVTFSDGTRVIGGVDVVQVGEDEQVERQRVHVAAPYVFL